MEKIWFCSDKSGHRTALKLNDEADGLQVGGYACVWFCFIRTKK